MRRRPIFASLLVFVLAGCSGDANNTIVSIPSRAPTQVVQISGDGQLGEPGTVSDRLMVRVLAADQTPVEDVTVFFSATTPHSVLDSQTTTDANGLAFTSVVFGDRAGRFTVQATVPTLAGSPVVFNLSTIGVASTVFSTQIGHVDIPTAITNPGDVFGGYLHEIVAVGTMAFIPTGAFGDGVVVVDLQNPVVPRFAGQTIGFRSRDIAVQGSWLYSVDGNSFNTVDITDPLAGTIGGTLALNADAGAAAVSVAVSGSVAFVTGGGPTLADFAALQSIDVTNPSNPVAGARSDRAGGADVLLNGNYAYVAAYAHGLDIYDISSPLDSLPLAGNAGTGGNAMRLLWRNGLAYVLNETGSVISIAIVVINQPETPRLVSTVRIPSRWGTASGFVGMALAGNRLYVGGSRGVVVVDVSSPAAPNPLGRVDPEGFVGGIAALGDRVVVAHLTGVSVIEIAPVAAPAHRAE